MVQCNQDPLYWVPQSNSVLQSAAETWVNNDMGGCNGGMPLLAIAFMQDRGVGTCDQSTGCATGCVPYPFVPEGSGAQSSAPRPIIWHAAQDAEPIAVRSKNCGNGVQDGVQGSGRRNTRGKSMINTDERGAHSSGLRRVGKGKAPAGCHDSHTSTLSSQCPFWCMKKDEQGKCLQFNEGTCRDGKSIFHYHNLHPVWFSPTTDQGDQLPPGSTERVPLSDASMKTIMRQLWEHGPTTAAMAIYQDPMAAYNELVDIMITGNVYMENLRDAIIHGFHAVVIVGWGVTVSGLLYWKVATSETVRQYLYMYVY